MQHKDKFGT